MQKRPWVIAGGGISVSVKTTKMWGLRLKRELFLRSWVMNEWVSYRRSTTEDVGRRWWTHGRWGGRGRWERRLHWRADVRRRVSEWGHDLSDLSECRALVVCGVVTAPWRVGLHCIDFILADSFGHHSPSTFHSSQGRLSEDRSGTGLPKK